MDANQNDRKWRISAPDGIQQTVSALAHCRGGRLVAGARDGTARVSAILEREHFTVPQENKYFSLESLSKMIGQEPNQWRHAALKELIDNALDAAESVYPAISPNILIEFTKTENGLILSVADNGTGISRQGSANCGLHRQQQHQAVLSRSATRRARQRPQDLDWNSGRFGAGTRTPGY